MSSDSTAVETVRGSSEATPKNTHAQLRILGTILFGLVVAQAVVWVLEGGYKVFSDNDILWLGHVAHGAVGLTAIYAFSIFLRHVHGGNGHSSENSEDVEPDGDGE